jgi:hypothetical protein
LALNEFYRDYIITQWFFFQSVVQNNQHWGNNF